MSYRFAFGRPPTVAADAMVASSTSSASRAGLRMLERGGNAADAVLAAAAVLCVAEPMSTGIGGDAFAIVWRDGQASGLDAAGPAPAKADPDAPVERFGPRSVTVPGAVAGWAALAESYGRLGLDTCIAEAIDLAETGFAVGPRAAAAWTSDVLRPAPQAGERVRFPELAATLRAIAAEGPDTMYRGRVADAITAASWLDADDLARYRPRWVDVLRMPYRGVEVVELPPPTQGVVALEALGLLALGEPTPSSQVECVRLALEDGFATVRDGADVERLIAPNYLRQRMLDARTPVAEPPGGTVYLCAVDGDRTAVSFIQSLYEPFGSGVVAPGTGILLQNRSAGFFVSGRLEPGRRPYHTTIPGLLLREGGLWGPFGVMGGFMQAQGHVQVVSALVDDGLDPQAALDRPRFRLDEGSLFVEPGLALPGTVVDDDPAFFGGGQLILTDGDALVAGSDARKDGFAAGF